MHDKHSSIKINGFCDEVMIKLMDKLKIPIMSYNV